MSAEVVRWCPHCRRLTQNALTSPPVYDAPWGEEAHGDAARVARFRRYCGACGEIWESVEAPAAMWDDLMQLPLRLEEAQRRLAMLRLLLARDREVNAEEAPRTLPLRRAA